MDTKQQWESPTETLDTVIGILTGLPVIETFGMDAIGVATDAMNEIMDLRRKLSEANRVIHEIDAKVIEFARRSYKQVVSTREVHIPFEDWDSFRDFAVDIHKSTLQRDM